MFRLRIPADFKPVVGKSGFRYSLRSGILAVAKIRTQAIAGYIKKLFRRIRASISEWTQEQINKAVRVYVRETLANVENCRAICLNILMGAAGLLLASVGPIEEWGSHPCLSLVNEDLAVSSIRV